MSIGQLDPNPCRSLCPDLRAIKWGLKMREMLLLVSQASGELDGSPDRDFFFKSFGVFFFCDWMASCVGEHQHLQSLT